MRTNLLSFRLGFLGMIIAPMTLLASDHPIASPSGQSIPIARTIPADSPLERGVGLSVFVDGANHIVAQQCIDGGFGWPHDDCTTTFNNITGPILMGVLRAYEQTGDPSYLGAATDGGDFDLGFQFPNGEPRLGAFAAFFLSTLSDANGDPVYSDFVAAFFDQLSAGTYSDVDLDTMGWITAIETNRTGTWVNLRPWEFHLNVQTAADLGNAGQAELFIQGVLRGLNTLDNSDPDNVFTDILGLAGAVKGLALANRQVFPAISSPLHNGVDSMTTLGALGDLLVSYQNANGSWYWHSNLAAPVEGDEDSQTTAYAVLALAALDAVTGQSYAASIQAGQGYLESTQLVSGGFPSNPGGTENTEVEGEILWALAAGPAPASLEVPALGTFGMSFLTLMLCFVALRRFR